MKLRKQHQVLVLYLCVAFSTTSWISGCAGMAEPLPSLSVTPTAMSVSAKIGTLTTQAAHVTNVGTTPVSVSQVVVTGAGFSVSGLATPVILTPKQTQSFIVKFTPATAGTVNGSLAIMTDLEHRPIVLSLHATAATVSPAVSSVSVTPAAAAPTAGAKVQFTAAVQGTTTNDAVTWTATMGTITATGVYTAPTAASTGMVTATSVADPTKSASAVVTVAAATSSGNPPSNPPSAPAVASVAVSPATASSVVGGTLSFAASVQGSTANKVVTWKAALGTISASGAYTAPAKAGTDVVTATSVADTTKSATATVAVTSAPTNNPPPAPSVSGVTVSPNSSSVTASGTIQFSATVQGSATDKSVSWRAAAGTITSSGFYTAPAKAGSDTVTATSHADAAKSASATVTVNAPAPPAPTPPPSSQSTSCNGGCPAFPGAQGGGAGSAGGRGGVVMEVTNLNDSGVGSLRACVEATGARTCVFRVAGIITPLSDMLITSPYLTVAGQTAPGQIIVGGPGNTGFNFRISTHDTVVRYITFSPDNVNTPSGPDTGTTGYTIVNTQAYNNIADHLSLRWAGNKSWLSEANFSGEYERDETLQWSLIYEPHEGHPVGPSTTSNGDPTNSAASVNNDFHHNLLVNIDHRIPEYNNGSLRWINNITYNYSWYAVEGLGGTQSDVIGNIWDCNNMCPSQNYPIHASEGVGNSEGDIPAHPSFYVAGNIGPASAHASNPPTDQIGSLTYQITGENGSEINGHFPDNWLRSSPLPASNGFPIVPDDATRLPGILAPTVGNSQHLDCNGAWQSHRDPQDNRIVQEFTGHGPGGFWPNGVTYIGQTSFPTPASDWQDHPVTNATACQESLHDGIPDQWKAAKGLSTSDPNLHNAVAPNGFTWLENYLSGQ